MRKLYFVLVLCMLWTSVALADVTIDGITYSLNTSTSTATVTNTPSGSVVIPATVTYNNLTYNVTVVSRVDYHVISVDLPSTIQRIEKRAFSGCEELISVNLPEGLISISDGAFNNCSSLPSITIPTTITYIGEAAFRDCTNLKKIIWNAKHCADFASSDAAPFNFFSYQGKHEEDYQNDYTSSIKFGDEVEYIPAYLCYNFTLLSTVVIPNSVKCIGEYAFYGRYHNAKENSEYDSNLTSVLFGTGLEEIGIKAFYGRKGLSTITLYDNCTTIGAYAFYDCSRLSTVTFGKSISMIGIWAFNYCNTINIYANTPPNIASNFNNISAIILNVPSKAVDAYKAANVWKGMTIKAMENDVRTFTLSVSSTDENKGITTQGGAYDEDCEILIYAAAKDGYKFSKWNDGNTENPRIVKMTGNLSLAAQFEAATPLHTITASSNASEGTVVGGGKYEFGSQATLAAVGKPGYHFTQWNDGNTDNPRLVTVVSDAMYFADFAQDPVAPTLYELSVKPENAGQGWTTEGGAYEYGKQVMIYAHPVSGYMFSQWSDGNKDNPRFLTITGNVNLKAQFEVQTPNSIRAINAETPISPARKIVRDGQVLIEYGDKIYTLQGIEVK